MKILMTIPHTKRGGVSSFCNAIIPYFSDIYITRRGVRDSTESRLKMILDGILDILSFLLKIIRYRFDFVFINTSLNKVPLIRDGIFIIIAKIFKKKVLLYIHGFEEELLSHKFLIKGYYSSNIIVVLSEYFKTKIISSGYKKKVVVSLNPVDLDILNLITKQDLTQRISRTPSNILFISRIEESKGVFIALNAYKILKIKFPRIKFIIAGNGSALNKAKNFVKDNNIKDVEFLGYIVGQKKIEILKKADIFLFPTYYNEGLPINILEAMCVGLPIISRPIGGVVDFFLDNKMGYLLPGLEPKEYSAKIEELINNNNDFGSICKYNFIFGREHFHPQQIAKNLKMILQELDKEFTHK